MGPTRSNPGHAVETDGNRGTAVRRIAPGHHRSVRTQGHEVQGTRTQRHHIGHRRRHVDDSRGVRSPDDDLPRGQERCAEKLSRRHLYGPRHSRWDESFPEKIFPTKC